MDIKEIKEALAKKKVEVPKEASDADLHALYKEKVDPKHEAPKTASKTKEEETVPVKVSVLEKINATLESQGKELEDTKEQLKRLESAADLGRLDKWDAEHKGKLIRKASLNLFRGQIVMGWKLVKDEVGVNEKGILVEKQDIKLFLDQGEGEELKEEVVPYIYFSRELEREECDIIKTSDDSQGNRTMVLKRAGDGREVEVGISFVN